MKLTLVPGDHDLTTRVRDLLVRSHDVEERDDVPADRGGGDAAVVVWPGRSQGRSGAMRLVAELDPATTLAVLPVDLTSDRLGLADGGVEYVVDPYHPIELLRRVDALGSVGGGRGRVLWAGDTMLDEGSRLVHRRGGHVELTRKEFALLAHLLRHVGMVQERPVLLEAVWSSTSYNPNVIEVTMSSLRHKLEEQGPRILHTVRGVGYVCRPDAPVAGSLPALRDRRASLLHERERLALRRADLIEQARAGREQWSAASPDGSRGA